MYILKMKTIIIYISVFAIICTSLGVYFAYNETVSVSAEEKIEVPIIMYHSILNDTKKTSKFIITPSQFEEDLKFIKENGYETVFMSDIINYVHKGTPLPEKPIVLTFDDGYHNNYLYIYPLLKKYNMKAVISVVGIYTDLYSQTEDNAAEYAHLSWDTVNELMESGYIEFQNHSYNLHSVDKGRNGSKKKATESLENYQQMLTDDLTMLQNEFLEHTGYSPDVYTYPFGAVSKASFDIIKKIGFKASLSCENKMNYIKTGDTDCLYLMNRFIRTPVKSLKTILK